MRVYLDIIQHILDNGQWKENRTGIQCLTAPNIMFSHDMENGYPLLTTRKMPFKSMCVELEGFLKGIVSKRWYQNRNCSFWGNWANPKTVEEKYQKEFSSCYSCNCQHTEARKRIQKEIDSLGPIYGYQWRRFGECYDEDDDGVIKGFDQLKYIVDTLHNNPNDRRMVCSAWNPNHLSRQSLPSCHLIWGLVHLNGVLNLWWTQRSCDFMLGVSNNIASYALLLLLLCKESGFRPGNLTGLLADCHIYENHIEQAKEQLSRQPRELPQLEIPNENWTDIFNWTYKNMKLINYNPHSKLKMKIAI